MRAKNEALYRETNFTPNLEWIKNKDSLDNDRK